MSKDVEIVSDGVTVWVHAPQGTIARFGRNGIDVHTSDTSACLHCTHEATTTNAQWREFVSDVERFYGITVGNEHRPLRIEPS